ncbi:MAG TPA: M14 family zinc carboxypeptidase, partial [Methylomirabilota bacterium]|nr:M14 family zinc carboxypeptidase [Methylomirabilota bacterium]
MRVAIVLGALLLANVVRSAEVVKHTNLPPTSVRMLRQAPELFAGATFNPNLPAPEKFLGFKAGERAANSEQIAQTLKAWAAAAPNTTRLVEYARSHENRPLHYMVVSSAENIQRLEEIRAGMSKLADPRKTSAEEAKELIEKLPGVAWLAYSIHGDETEGSDAALIVLHRLVASQEPEIEKLLKDLVIIVDPLMNPDGRDRFLKMIAEHRGAMPNFDDQSFLHTGYWPAGRGNHYLFDLNRDWILAVHPESRGRIREFGRWNPLLLVDAHGMGAQDTHLFSPPREPLNPNFPAGQRNLSIEFARDQAKAFDARGLLYYTREWYESWYPGYSDAYACYRGAVGILYEQARIAEDGVRRPGGAILSYSESVQHHVIGSFANLLTLQTNAQRLRQHLYDTRREAVSESGRYANRTFAILPTKNDSRLVDLIQRLEIQGFELHRATNTFTAPVAKDQLGREERNRTIPAGTILIPNRQPLAHLLAAM